MSAEADELILYADNDSELYHNSFLPIVNNLKRRVSKGTYHPILATKLWMYHAERAAKKYGKEFLNPGEWYRIFPIQVRKEAASHWESYARREYLKIPSHDRRRKYR